MCLCWKELQALFQRDWFSRAWVVQEAALSREVLIVCGKYSISWSQLLVALKCVPSIPIRPLSGVPLPSHMAVIEKLRQELADGQSSLEKILLRNSSCQATNAVDRIYAFCGLIKQTELKKLGLLVPDYGEPGPSWNDEKAENLFRNLCKKVAVNILNNSGTLDLLSGPVGNPKARSAWPSWIPDWEAEKRPRCLVLDQPSFNATRGERSPQDVVFDNDKAFLGLEGFVFDRVEEMSNVVDKGPPSTWTFAQYQAYKGRMEAMIEYLQRCLEWEDITNARSKAHYVGGAESMLDVYWKTLLGGHVTAENAERQGREFHRFDMISKHGAKVLRDLGLQAWPWIMLLTPYNIAVLFARAFLTRRDYAGLLRIGDFTSNPNHGIYRTGPCSNALWGCGSFVKRR
ncbi:Heterokaryon incompatibility protein 6, OR allele [Madurella mycetomatis]|uniref:Heterokaryon incompatibility protein 6, OR allele n=1 Tax=Madurella mycetomatis TaxID=100816 RepID=A0A175WC41_9PEZI|nr:Heterokaryon incompatibility protein 6, OR allele [Madurella mycetomatis]